MIVVGVDPGKSGALVALRGDRVVGQLRMPLLSGTRDIDSKAIAEFLLLHDPKIVAQELVRSRPENGVKQAFEFGRSAEVCRTLSLALGFAFVEVVPQVWLRLVDGLPSGLERRERKQRVAAEAGIRWPELDLRRIADWGRADAAFIALWGVSKLPTSSGPRRR